ncbi:MAG: GyrI-like domain-containing protein, partial [Deltaproteobacteria bacterium]|nr:GyrI-like domain-containing protein [Deltaproteobacteria bacterium]
RSALTMIMGLSHVDCQKQGDDMFTYRAGAIVADDFAHSTGLQQRPFVGGKYAMFEYTGSYANLPKAFEFVMGQMKASRHSMRDDFCVEVYIDSPEDTPEEMLRTQIFIPIES